MPQAAVMSGMQRTLTVTSRGRDAGHMPLTWTTSAARNCMDAGPRRSAWRCCGCGDPQRLRPGLEQQAAQPIPRNAGTQQDVADEPEQDGTPEDEGGHVLSLLRRGLHEFVQVVRQPAGRLLRGGRLGVQHAAVLLT